MKVLDGRNNVKVYKLSGGKSLPDWLSERKRRKLSKRDVDIRHRIELIQDFDMPDVSNCISVSPDGQYIVATGTYKPRMKCFEVSALSLKFERCFDGEVITFDILSEDYSKIVFLQEDRHLEFHNQGGRWFRTRIPKFGRDLAYHYPSSDLYIGTSGNTIIRLNLDQGKFLSPLQTDALSVNKCIFNPVHYLLACGTEDGKVEAWDPRSRHRVGVLDCALHMVHEDIPLPIYKSVKELGVTSLAYNDALTLAVGTQTGQILLYDIRSNKPVLIKDHMDGLPIKDLEFHPSSRKVISMSSNAVKVWEKDTGKPHTSIESDVCFNDLCSVPDSGMIFIATEDTKMQIYFLPSLGAAPKWCGHLDALIEELEEEEVMPEYDDYKFVTEDDLKQLGLNNLIGSNVLRAVMHGYYMDVRLYNKAKAISKPNDFDESLKKKVKQKISELNERRIFAAKLSSKNATVNKESLMRLQEDMEGKGEAKFTATTILDDERFNSLFTKPEFIVDKEAEIFKVTQPLVRSKDKSKMRQDDDSEEERENELEEKMDVEDESQSSSDSDSIISGSSSDEEEAKSPTPPLEKKKRNRPQKRLKAATSNAMSNMKNFSSADTLKELREYSLDLSKLTLEKRLEQVELQDDCLVRDNPLGSKEMDFALAKSSKFEKLRQQQREHRHQRREVIRPTAKLKGKIKFNKPIF